MIFHVCPRCHYETSDKSHLRNHYNRKRKCKTIFSRKSIKNCLTELDSKQEKVTISREEYEELKNMAKTTNITNNNNVQINNTNYIININDFNNTNYINALDDLKKSINQSLLKNGGKNLNIECENLVELVHCNEKYPENQNILLTDRNRGEVKVKKGENFINVPIDDAIDETSKNIINLLKENDLFKRQIEFHEKKDEDTLKEDKKAIERTLYNNRFMILNTARENGLKI